MAEIMSLSFLIRPLYLVLPDVGYFDITAPLLRLLNFKNGAKKRVAFYKCTARYIIFYMLLKVGLFFTVYSLEKCSSKKHQDIRLAPILSAVLHLFVTVFNVSLCTIFPIKSTSQQLLFALPWEKKIKKDALTCIFSPDGK